MEIYARQGDLVIDKLLTPITGDLIPSKDTVFAGDSSGHRHALVGIAAIRREGLRTLVRVQEERILEHQKAGGHKPIVLVPGDYEISPLRERGSSEDRAVED